MSAGGTPSKRTPPLVSLRPDGFSSAPPRRALEPPSELEPLSDNLRWVVPSVGASNDVSARPPRSGSTLLAEGLSAPPSQRISATALALDGAQLTPQRVSFPARGFMGSVPPAPQHVVGPLPGPGSTALVWTPPAVLPPSPQLEREAPSPLGPGDPAAAALTADRLTGVDLPRSVSSVRRIPLWALAAASGLACLLSALAVAWVMVREPPPAPASEPLKHEDPARAPAVATRTLPKLVPRAPVPCLVAREARLLAPSVLPNVPVSPLTLPGGTHVALGFSDTRGSSVGMTVDAATLRSSVVYQDAGVGGVLGVVPVLLEGGYNFSIDRPSVGWLRESATVGAEYTFSLGVTNLGLALARRRHAQPTVIWPLASVTEVTRPEVRGAHRGRHAVVVRVAGSAGQIHLGWLEHDGERASDLAPLPFRGQQLGAPSLAVRGNTALVSAAVRASENDPWRVQLVLASPEGAKRLTRMAVPDGGPGGQAIAPRVAALEDGRWLYQWTEGDRGDRVVRATALDAELVPIGAPVTLSNPKLNAGAGALSAVDGGALAVYLVQDKSGYQLWGATLACN